MQKHSKPIYTCRFLGRMKLGHRWGALLCVCKLISPRALLRRTHLDSQRLQHSLGQTQEILSFLLSVQCTPALNTSCMQWAYTKPSLLHWQGLYEGRLSTMYVSISWFPAETLIKMRCCIHSSVFFHKCWEVPTPVSKVLWVLWPCQTTLIYCY